MLFLFLWFVSVYRILILYSFVQGLANVEQFGYSKQLLPETRRDQMISAEGIIAPFPGTTHHTNHQHVRLVMDHSFYFIWTLCIALTSCLCVWMDCARRPGPYTTTQGILAPEVPRVAFDAQILAVVPDLWQFTTCGWSFCHIQPCSCCHLAFHAFRSAGWIRNVPIWVVCFFMCDGSIAGIITYNNWYILVLCSYWFALPWKEWWIRWICGVYDQWRHKEGLNMLPIWSPLSLSLYLWARLHLQDPTASPWESCIRMIQNV